jgi:hypothetical protein
VGIRLIELAGTVRAHGGLVVEEVLAGAVDVGAVGRFSGRSRTCPSPRRVSGSR